MKCGAQLWAGCPPLDQGACPGEASLVAKPEKCKTQMAKEGKKNTTRKLAYSTPFPKTSTSSPRSPLILGRSN
jgi:hypothetical protein